MSIRTYVDHLRLQKWLKMFSEDQLKEPLTKEVQKHLEQCNTCRINLQAITAINTQLRAESELQSEAIATSKDRVWKQVVNHLEEAPANGIRISNWRHIAWAMACTILLSASAAFWWKGRTAISSPGMSLQSSSSFDLNGLINAFHQPDLREAFYQSQGTIPISPTDCCSNQFYNAELLSSLQEHCEILQQRFLSSADGKSVLLECKIAGKTVAILQQKDSVRNNFPREVKEKTLITGVECEQILSNGIAITRWRQSNGQITVVGSLSKQELELLVDASK